MLRPSDVAQTAVTTTCFRAEQMSASGSALAAPRSGAVGTFTGARPRERTRRIQIVNAALALAADGYEGVHIRLVAEHIGVATSTVYRYFPSKDALLVACLHDWLTEFARTRAYSASETDALSDELPSFVRSFTSAMFGSVGTASAFMRAYLFADGAAADSAEKVRTQMSAMFRDALCPFDTGVNAQEVGILIADLWAANALSVVQGRTAVHEMQHRLQTAIRLLERNWRAAGSLAT